MKACCYTVRLYQKVCSLDLIPQRDGIRPPNKRHRRCHVRRRRRRGKYGSTTSRDHRMTHCVRQYICQGTPPASAPRWLHQHLLRRSMIAMAANNTVILGAGIIGCSTAFYLSDSPHTQAQNVHLVEASPELFHCASGFAAGFLASDCLHFPYI